MNGRMIQTAAGSARTRSNICSTSGGIPLRQLLERLRAGHARHRRNRRAEHAGDDGADDAGHQTRERAVARGRSAAASVLLQQVGRQHAAGNHPETAARVQAAHERERDSTPMNTPPNSAGCSLEAHQS